ncbi:hypothetical protein EV179_006194 [Coemansia sp. RSA 487]|nr:hypothetical protein LPJ74_001890 [Coemansia sp. RSA 1843]KAJ2210515.1 hypothetical protein EV179_006194 [Coemansia sp. RSA 487]
MMESTEIQLSPDGSRTVRLDCPAHVASTVSLSEIQRFPPFKHWLSALQQQSNSEVVVKSITIQSVDRFKSGKIGFLKLAALAHHLPDNTAVPGIVFLRGGAVAILLILRSEEKEYAILTEQPRLAVPDFRMLELPAGMLDDDGAFAGTAAREILEETGLTIAPHELIDLTTHASKGLYPSSGACDEFIRLFACLKHVTSKELDDIKGRLSGLREDGEFITVRLVPLDQLWQSTMDMKATSALYLWNQHNQQQSK